MRNAGSRIAKLLIAVFLLLSIADSAEAGRRRRYHSPQALAAPQAAPAFEAAYPEPAISAYEQQQYAAPATYYFPPVTANPLYERRIVIVPAPRLSLETRVSQILSASGLGAGSIPSGLVSAEDDVILALAFKWAQVQKPLEELFQDELQLEYRPQLILILRESGEEKNKGRLVITHPQNERVVQVLSRALLFPTSRFDENIKIYGERMTFKTEEFKSSFRSGSTLDLISVQSAIQQLLQGDPNLAAKAARLRGAFKVVRAPHAISATHTRVVTEWQRFNGDGNLNVYWRANTLVEQQPQKQWEIETLIEFGQLNRSQSFDQIKPFTNSDRLGAFDTVAMGDAIVNGIPSRLMDVRYKAVLSVSERLLEKEHREGFGELASDLWNGIKDKLTDRK